MPDVFSSNLQRKVITGSLQHRKFDIFYAQKDPGTRKNGTKVCGPRMHETKNEAWRLQTEIKHAGTAFWRHRTSGARHCEDLLSCVYFLPIYIYVCINMRISTCLYMYICIYIHIYIYVHIYIQV